MPLLDFYAPEGPERVGFILLSGEMVEVENIYAAPNDGFSISTEDLIKYETLARATFHTHPGITSNLSGEDYKAFKCWPSYTHYIIGKDGVRSYSVNSGGVVICNEETDLPSRVFEGALP